MADWKKGDVVYAARGAEVMNVCSNASPPTDDHECLAAIWSQGRECKKCPREDCYRQGWDHASVTRDNVRRVNARARAAMAKEPKP